MNTKITHPNGGIRAALIIVVILIFHGMNLHAQDGHYWTQQYGTRSILLSNSAIGGVNDLAALYYNPARLSLIENPAFLLNADVFEVSQIKFDDAVGEGASRTKTTFGSVPSFVAGTFKIKWLEGHSFGYSILQRQNSDINFNYRDETFGDVISNFPGEELFGADIKFSQETKEEWYSISWSYPIGERLSIGATASATRYSSSKGTQIELQALSSMNQVAQFQFDRDYSLNQYGLLWKLGVAGENRSFNWGITLTTPLVQLFNKGDYNYKEFFSGIDGSTSPDRFSTSFQEDINTRYKRPLSIGGGVSFPIGKSELYFSSEWYSAVNRYKMLEATPHASQSSGDTIRFTLVDDLSSVTNFGIGAQIYMSDKFSGYLSVSTDFSAAPETVTGFAQNEPEANNTVFSADFIHLAGGVVLNWKRADITLGASYTGGDQEFARPVDFPEEGDDGIFDKDETGTFRWNRMRVIFSFSFPFLNRDKDNE